jgi:rod shape-determining protein MreC
MKRFFGYLLLALVLLGAFFFFYRSRAGASEFLSGLTSSIFTIGREEESARRIAELEARNKVLELDLAELRSDSTRRIADDRYHYKTARVYSRYPFNDASLITINLGSDDGVKEGMPVFAAKGVLLGKIRSVSRTESEIETIWSPAMRVSVTVGSEGIKAVYLGGSSPSLDLIPKEAKISEGASVLSTSPEFPLSSSLGSVSEISSASYEVWQKAKVAPAFEVDMLRTVFVMVDFP